MTFRPILVTGCARSGTRFFAQLLRSLGLVCSHEHIFHPFTEIPNWSTYQAASSWLAVPFLNQLPESTIVIHLHRDPTLVIASNLNIGFFDDDPLPHHLPYRAVCDRILSDPKSMTPHQRAEQYWLRWNMLIEANLPRFDDHLQIGLAELCQKLSRQGQLRQLLEKAGYKINRNQIPQAISELPSNLNHKQNSKIHAYPPVPVASPAVEQLAFKYGYPLCRH